ncbi:MAG TPA: hypothetical protein VNG69_09605 [Casimicrobiaceae bacterium]|nr:hypothetical protein [Casimicrobiaceae bacterium]
MRRNSFPSIVISVLVILACGALGVWVGTGLTGAIGISGVFAAIVAITVSIVVAAVMFAAGVALLRRLKVLR